MAVVDASVVIAVLTGGEQVEWAERQLAATGPHRSLWAPHLIDAEVGNALRRLVALDTVRADRAADALLDLLDLPLRRIAHTGLLDRAWELRHNLSFYDGLYVALAEQLDAPLVTLDNRLARGVHGAVRVITAT